MKPSKVIRAEAQHYLNAGLTELNICNVVRERTKKMRRDGKKAPMCLKAFCFSLDDALGRRCVFAIGRTLPTCHLPQARHARP